MLNPTSRTANGNQHTSTDRDARVTAIAFVFAAIVAAIAAIVVWAVALPHLRVFIMERTQSSDATLSWFRVLDFARIISVLCSAIIVGLIASRFVSRPSSTQSGG